MGGIEWRWEFLGEVDSTNEIAARRVMECWGRGERAAGTVIVAKRQWVGRGQRGKVWESPMGGLYMSAVVEGDQVAIELRDKLALIAGVAVAEGLQEAGCYVEEGRARVEGGGGWKVEVGIRWPNDVMVRESKRPIGRLAVPGGQWKKVGGILCEAVSQGQRWAAVIGMGVNVMTEVAAFSAELRDGAEKGGATSLLAHDGRERAVAGVGRAIVGRLDGVLEMCRERGLGRVVERVRELDMLMGRRITFDMGEREVEAVAEGIDREGRLLLRLGNGEVMAVSRGSILRME